MSDSPFIEALARTQPIPGGGAAAAYGATVGLALLEKIIRLERGRPKADQQTLLGWDEALIRVQELTDHCSRLREEDGRAYLKMTRARAAGARDQELLAATLKALDVPRRIMAAGREALGLTVRVGQGCRGHLVSDLMVVGELLAAAIQGAYHIARANLPRLKNPGVRTNWEDELSQAAARGQDAYLRLKEFLLSRDSW